jgi:multisubunit Na+/H+ antiporter MnhC subunit
VSQPSFYGWLSQNAYGWNVAKKFALKQVQSNDVALLILPVGSSEGRKLVYPMPTWRERVYVHEFYSTKAELIVLTVSIVAFLFALLLLAITIAYRYHPKFRAQSVPFSIMIICSSLIAFVGVHTNGLENSELTCVTRVWTLVLSKAMFMCPLIARTRRLIVIFSGIADGKALNAIRKITNCEVARWVILLASPFLLLLVVFTAVVPMHDVNRITVDPLRPQYDYTACNSTVRFRTFLIVIASLGYIYVATLLVMAYQSRVVFKRFREGRAIVLTAYVWSLSLLVLLVVQLVLATTKNVSRDQRISAYLMRSFAIISAFFLSLVILFGQRLLDVASIWCPNWCNNDGTEIEHANATMAETGLKQRELTRLGLHKSKDVMKSNSGGPLIPICVDPSLEHTATPRSIAGRFQSVSMPDSDDSFSARDSIPVSDDSFSARDDTASPRVGGRYQSVSATFRQHALFSQDASGADAVA